VDLIKNKPKIQDQTQFLSRQQLKRMELRVIILSRVKITDYMELDYNNFAPIIFNQRMFLYLKKMINLA